jgi:hypothetical protein
MSLSVLLVLSMLGMTAVTAWVLNTGLQYSQPFALGVLCEHAYDRWFRSPVDPTGLSHFVFMDLRSIHFCYNFLIILTSTLIILVHETDLLSAMQTPMADQGSPSIHYDDPAHEGAQSNAHGNAVDGVPDNVGAIAAGAAAAGVVAAGAGAIAANPGAIAAGPSAAAAARDVHMQGAMEHLMSIFNNLHIDGDSPTDRLPLPDPAPTLMPGSLPAMIAVLTELATSLREQRNNQPPPPAAAPAPSARHIGRPNKLNLELQVGADGVTAQQALDLWVFATEHFLQAARIPKNDWAATALPYLEGQARQSLKDFMGPHARLLTWENLKETLYRTVQGADDSPFDILLRLWDFSIGLACTETGSSTKTLLHGVVQWENLLARVPFQLPEQLKCFLLYKALPATLRNFIRYDVSTGVNHEWADYNRMRINVLSYNGAFQDHIRSHYAPQLKTKAEVAQPTKRARTDDGNRPASIPSGSSAPPPGPPPPGPSRNYWNPETEVPLSRRRLAPPAGEESSWTFFRRGLTRSKSDALKTQRMCLVCEKGGHRANECPNRESKYNEGSFFYYPKGLRN